MGPVGTLNYDPTAGETPPQAPTPAQTPMDANAIAQAQSAQDVLRQANYGDTGAQQYQNLVAAGQPPTTAPAAPAPASPLASMVGNAPAVPLGMSAPNATSPIANALIAFGGGDPYKRREEMARLVQTQQAVNIQKQQFIQSQAKNDNEFLDSLKKIAPQYRTGMIQEYFARQGREIPHAVAQTIADQSVLAHMTAPEITARIDSDPQFAWTYWNSLDKPKEFLTLHDDLVKAHAEADKQIALATKQQSQARVQTATESTDIHLKQLEETLRQKSVDEYDASLDRMISSEAQKKGMQPGTPDYTNYTQQRKAQLDAYAKRQLLKNKPLEGKMADDFNQADRAGKFASSLLDLLKDPKVVDDRGVLEGRIRTLLRQAGFSQGENEDVYQSMSNISGLMGSKVYSGGIRNMQWINRVLEHTPQPGDQPELLRDKMNVILRAAREQQQGIINIQNTGRGVLQPTVAEPTGLAGSVGGGTTGAVPTGAPAGANIVTNLNDLL